MKLHSIFTAAAVGLATLGQLVPAPLLFAGQPTQPQSLTKPNVTALDVVLTEQGTLNGELFDARREPVRNATVSVRQGLNEIAKTETDENGHFKIDGLKPGMCYIVAGSGHGLYRIWNSGKQPPKSFTTVKIVSDKSLADTAKADSGTTVRGQSPGDGRVMFDQNGVAYGQVRVVDQAGLVPLGPGAPVGVTGGGTFLSNLGIYDAALLGLGAGAIAVGAVAIDKANKNEKKIDNLKKTP